MAVLTIGGLLVAACGGGDDDAAEPDDATTTEDDGGEPTTEDDGSEPATDDDGSEPATDDDDDTSDGSPVVETIAPEEDADPVFGGTLRYGLTADTNGINPAASSMSVNGLMMGNAVFDTLSATTPDGQWVPYLAESFTPNDDYTQWTMKLREGISFHDGTPLNAEAIVTNIMVKAMNRSLGAVLFKTFGASDAAIGADDGEERVARQGTPEDVAVTLAYAKRVVIVPGYGLAVAQAQHTIRELATILEDRGVNVRYAIHPVAGRMPGHMNVLLAEADVPYDQLYDLEDINPEFSSTDVTLVVGANDVVNPLARNDANSPIYGMPILDVDKSNLVVVVKRSLSPGYAGIDNPLFYDDTTLMLFADAKAGLADVVSAVKEL